jgi:hypothetical protein
MNNKKTLKDWWNERQKSQKVFTIIGVVVFIGVASGCNEGSSKSSYSESTSSGCEGNGSENCISEIRSLVSGSGKTILSEQYEGNGKFQVQFMGNGGTYNATYFMDCDCKPSSVDVTTL